MKQYRNSPAVVRETIDPAHAAFIKRRVQDIVESAMRHCGFDGQLMQTVALSCYQQAVIDMVQLHIQRPDVVPLPTRDGKIDGIALPTGEVFA